MSGNDPGSTMIASIYMGGITHAVTITSQNSNGSYQAYDPSTGNTSTINSDQIATLGIVCGIK